MRRAVWLVLALVLLPLAGAADTVDYAAASPACVSRAGAVAGDLCQASQRGRIAVPACDDTSCDMRFDLAAQGFGSGATATALALTIETSRAPAPLCANGGPGATRACGVIRSVTLPITADTCLEFATIATLVHVDAAAQATSTATWDVCNIGGMYGILRFTGSG